MAKYVPGDHGKVVDGKIVVFFQTAPADQAQSAVRPSPAERAETARLQAAALTAAAQKGGPSARSANRRAGSSRNSAERRSPAPSKCWTAIFTSAWDAIRNVSGPRRAAS